MKYFTRQLLFLTIVLSTFTKTFCQSNTNQLEGKDKVNSLLKVLPKQKEDTNKVQVLMDISYTYSRISPYEGIEYAEKALILAEKLHWKLGIARSNSCIGANYFSLSNFPLAYKYWLISLEECEEIDFQQGVANHLNNIGNVFYSQRNYSVALEYYEKALSTNLKIGNEKSITVIYTAIGNVHAKQKEYKKALDYHYKALAIDLKHNIKSNIGSDYINIGSIYNDEENYTKALNELFEGMQFKKLVGENQGLANAYCLIGNVYLNIAKKDFNSNTLNQSIKYSDSALTIGERIGFLDNMQKTYHNLSDAYSLLNNDKQAFETYKHYTLIKDSIFSIDKQSDIFNLKKKEELEERKWESEKEEKAKESREYIQMGGIGMFILIMVFILLILRKKKNNPKLIEFLCTFFVLVLFEFLNLLIHAKVEDLTEHNLILTLLCLLVTASIIIPIHHKMEHWLKMKLANKDKMHH